MKPRLAAAVAATRLTALACAAGRRGGTSLPGLVGLRIDPLLVERLAGGLAGAIVVAGTNGKTTTSSWIGTALRAGRLRILHNREGSNMLRGLATTLARRSTLTGRLIGKRRPVGLFEVDEAALPSVLAQVRPSVVVITNLFRDQLDRYSEIALIAAAWSRPLAVLPAETTLVLNADDPLVASLGRSRLGKVIYYGVEAWPGAPNNEPRRSADSLYCPECATGLIFSELAYSHLGRYSCPGCGLQRPAPSVWARVHAEGPDGTTLTVGIGEMTFEVRLGIPGRYNVYNAVAAIAAATVAGVDPETAVRAIEGAKGVFVRAETIDVDGRAVRLYLVKNPTGADEVLGVIAAGDKDGNLLTLLSDNAADGHDVSWIWDARFELLADWRGGVSCSGTRAEDMALRLKYAGLTTKAILVPNDITEAVRGAVDRTPRGGVLSIVATYTAMLAARDVLSRAGHVDPYWRRAG
jgi:lipid II isoglutaminyl synthase (glutamine-hydrolysing)